MSLADDMHESLRVTFRAYMIPANGLGFGRDAWMNRLAEQWADVCVHRMRQEGILEDDQ